MFERIRQIFEQTYVAVAFAESGEHETAARFSSGVIAGDRLPVSAAAQAFVTHMAASAFAEAGEFASALAMVSGENKTNYGHGRSLERFLEDVGLKGVRVCYGYARI